MTSKKATPMNKDETMLLVQLVANNNIINNRATNATNNKLKDQAWHSLTNEFNSSITSCPRTPAQLRLKWENLKKAARKRCASMRSSLIKTGGGKDYFPPDEVLDKVASLLGSTCQGFSVEFGGDATTTADSAGEVHTYVESELHGGDFINIECGVGGDSISGGSASNTGDGPVEVLKEIQILHTPPLKPQKLFFNSNSSLAKRKKRMDEDKCKASIQRDTALAEYLLAKKRKLDLENEEKEVLLAKLKLELDNARLENLKLKANCLD